VTPVEVSQAAAELTHRWGSVDEFIDFVVEPKREKHANGDEETYFSADSSAFLAPVEIAALQRFKEGNDVCGYPLRYSSTGRLTRRAVMLPSLPK
jgi:hypothetical protein